MKILVTGGAGFIGSHLVDRLLFMGYEVINIDNFDTFYSRETKLKNIANQLSSKKYNLIEADISDYNVMKDIKSIKNIDVIIHLAAKAGVRPSIENTSSYFNANLMGTINVLNFAKENGIKQIVFASSSSVYGSNPSVPWKESDLELQPISPYASSKIAAENIGRVYSHLCDIRFTCLRFFTVYGPRQRPDLAIHKFFKHIINSEPITLYGNGSTKRDYTYIDDVVAGIISAIGYKNKNKFEVFNLGNSHTISLINLVQNIEEVCQKKAIINYLPEQPGDVEQTFAD
ncbi:MAG: SDR family NAD(P)-dependent oxidoreductase, partial [Bacteroidia bacterium]|nr:SDR family NAD(P)-dependent oxidoreductase [Bacteroidia bacterium]